jgi:hypothetical protein
VGEKDPDSDTLFYSVPLNVESGAPVTFPGDIVDLGHIFKADPDTNLSGLREVLNMCNT